MTDVASLIVRAAYDGTELSRGLRGSAAEISRFGAEVKALNGTARTFRLPEPARNTTAAIDKAVATLKALGVSLKEVERDAAGSRVFATVGKDAETAAKVFAQMGANARVVTSEMAASAQELAKVDAALRQRITLLSEGARMASTEAESLRQLRTVYASLSREVASGSTPLERRIQLERELVRIRQQFAATTTASRSTVAADFAAAAAPIQRTAAALSQVRTQTENATRSFALINRQTGEFTALGRRASGAAVGVAFGLEALARGGAAAEGGLRTALRSVAAFAAVLGPQGLIVSGAAAGTAAIIDLFKNAREQMEATQKEFAERVSAMIQSADREGLKAQLRNLQQGVLTLDPKDNTVKLAGGIAQAGAEAAALVDSLSRVSKISRDLRLSDILSSGSVGVEHSPLVAEIDAVNKKLQEMLRQAKGIEAAISATAHTLPGVRVEGRSDVDLAREAYEQLQKQVDNTVQAAERLVGKHVEQRRLGIELVRLHREVSEKMSQEKDVASAAANAYADMAAKIEKVGVFQSTLRDQRNLMLMGLKSFGFPIAFKLEPTQLQDEITRVIRSAPKSLEIPFDIKLNEPFNLRNFEAAIERLREAQGLVDFSKLTGDAGMQREAEQRLIRAQSAVQEYSLNVAAAMALANGQFGLHAAILKEIERLTKGLKGGAESASDLADNIRVITTAGRGLVQTADSLGLIGDNARQALDGVLQLADAIGTLNDKNLSALSRNLGFSIGAIGGVASLLQGLGVIGQSPAEQERSRLMRANNEELARLRLELSGFTNSIGQQLTLAGKLDQLRPELDAFIRARDRVEGGGRHGAAIELRDAIQALFADMKRLGLSIQELAVLAKAAGFDILDSSGNLIPEAIKVWADGLKAAAAAAVRFGDSFDEAREATSLLNRARGIADTPAQQIKDNADLFKDFSPILFEKFFGGIDFTTLNSSTIAQIRKKIVEFLETWLSNGGNGLDESLFQGLSPNEIRSIFDAWLTSIEGMTDATTAATNALLNLPSGFKIERFRFDATTPIRPETFTLPAGPTQPITPPRPPVPTTTGVTQQPPPPEGTLPNVTNLNVTGPIYVDARDKPAHELFEMVKNELQRRKRAISRDGPASDAFDVG